MKIVWHSMTSLGESELRTGYSQALERHLTQVARPDTEFEMMGTEVGQGNIYRSFQTFTKRKALMNLLTLSDRDDVDAVAMGNANDPVVREAREILTIPITGLLEASLLLAHMVSEEVAIIAESDKVSAKLRNNFAAYGLTDRVTGIYGLEGLGIEFIHDAYGDDDEAAAKRTAFLEEFGRQVARSKRDGAEAVIPGGNILAVLLNEAGVDNFDGVPVLNKTAVLVKVTEMMVDLYRSGAATTSRKATYRPPPSDELDGLLAAYGVR